MNKKDINKISILTLGCSRNVVDSENIIGYLKENEFEYVDSADEADALIINTCGFINSAKEESIGVILEAAAMRKSGGLKSLIVSGCLPQRYENELRRQIPEVDYYFGVRQFDGILKTLSGDRKYTLLGERSLLTPVHSAYLKISEGCSHKCSFCAIPSIRGRHITKPCEAIIEEVEALVRKGTKELVLTSEDTTYYGKDLYGKRELAGLLRKLSDIDGVEWIRLMYAYPTNFPLEVLDVIAERDNICSYIDIPLQHASDKILKSMNRGATRKDTEILINNIRERIPGAAIRSAFIVGYPGEAEDDFNELLDFIETNRLERVGVFQYSSEEGTPAHILGDPVPESVKQERADKLMLAQQKISLEKNKAKIGQTLKVLIDEESDGVYYGRTEQDAPEVDNTVIVESGRILKPGDFIRAEIYDAEEYDLYCKF